MILTIGQHSFEGSGRRGRISRKVLRRLALLLPLSLLILGPAGAEGPAHAPGAAASAWAIKVSVSSSAGAATPTAASPPNAAAVAGSAFSYPADGSIVSAQSTTASAATAVDRNASATAESDVTALSLWGGEITADAVTARASAGTGYSGAGGNVNGSLVTNLKIDGQPASGNQIALGDWGQLTIGSQGIDRSAPDGAKGYRGFVTEIDIQLTADHGGLPAGSDIQVGYAEAAAQTAPPAPPPPPSPLPSPSGQAQPQTTTTTTTTTTATTPTETTTTTAGGEAPTGDLPSLRPRRNAPVVNGPLKVHPKLTAAHYVFPVFGSVSYIDTFGAARSDVTFHHGDDIFGELGQPLVACADATVFSVGWN
jgi:hypothetical protein